MYFIKFSRKISFSFLTFFIVLLAVASITFGTINSSAYSTGSEQKPENYFSSDLQTRQFSFLTSNPAAFLNGDDTGQNGFSPESRKSEENGDSPVFAEFDAWAKKRVNDNLTNKSEYDELGERLAAGRREALKKLIQSNPKAALEKAISPENYKNLPSFITKYLEKRISADGDFLVYALDEIDHTTKKMNGSRIERTVVFDNSRYKAFVYGRRETMTTKYDIPLQGITIDDLMLVDESPARKLESKEYKSRAASLGKFKRNGIAAELGGKTVHFSNQTELDDFVNEQIEWESKIGPVRSKRNSVQDNLAPEAVSSAWTQGAKTVLVIRVDFSDRPGEPMDQDNQPLTVTRAQQILFANEVNPFYVSNSYNKTSMSATATPVVRLPQTLSFYTQGSNYNQLQEDARIAARQAGFETDDFSLDIVAFSYTRGFNFSGLSAIGAKGNLLNGAFYLQETAHELGHNYGLLHANLWRTTDGNPIGQGSNVEYGDCFDMMAAFCNLNSNSHFNTRYKRLLNWLTEENVETVTSNGDYRIYPQNAASPGVIRTLKIKKDDTKNYWVEFRTGLNGALVRWDYSSKNFNETQLLDMNPATPTTSDAPLSIGQGLYDSESGIRITVLRKENTPSESLIVRVELNLAVNCNYLLSPASANIFSYGGTGTTNVTTGATCNWAATSPDSWITVTGGSNGNGTVSFSVSPNLHSARPGTILIAGQTFSIFQAAGNCGYTISPTSFNIPASGGTVNYTENFNPGCNRLIPASSYPWISIDNSSITVLPNTGPARSGDITLTGEDVNGSAVEKILKVNQAGQTSDCTFSLSSASANFGSSGGSGSVNITSGTGCTWATVSNDSWITINGGANRSGSETINFSFTSNKASTARTGTITAGGQTFTITQAKSRRTRLIAF